MSAKAARDSRASFDAASPSSSFSLGGSESSLECAGGVRGGQRISVWDLVHPHSAASSSSSSSSSSSAPSNNNKAAVQQRHSEEENQRQQSGSGDSNTSRLIEGAETEEEEEGMMGRRGDGEASNKPQQQGRPRTKRPTTLNNGPNASQQKLAQPATASPKRKMTRTEQQQQRPSTQTATTTNQKAHESRESKKKQRRTRNKHGSEYSAFVSSFSLNSVDPSSSSASSSSSFASSSTTTSQRSQSPSSSSLLPTANEANGRGRSLRLSSSRKRNRIAYEQQPQDAEEEEEEEEIITAGARRLSSSSSCSSISSSSSTSSRHHTFALSESHLHLMAEALRYLEKYVLELWYCCPIHPAATSTDYLRYFLATDSAREESDPLALSVTVVLCLGSLSYGRHEIARHFWERGREYLEKLFDSTDLAVADALSGLAYYAWMHNDEERLTYFSILALNIARRAQKSTFVHYQQYLRALYVAHLLPSTSAQEKRLLRKEFNVARAHMPAHEFTSVAFLQRQRIGQLLDRASSSSPPATSLSSSPSFSSSAFPASRSSALTNSTNSSLSPLLTVPLSFSSSPYVSLERPNVTTPPERTSASGNGATTSSTPNSREATLNSNKHNADHNDQELTYEDMSFSIYKYNDISDLPWDVLPVMYKLWDFVWIRWDVLHAVDMFRANPSPQARQGLAQLLFILENWMEMQQRVLRSEKFPIPAKLVLQLTPLALKCELLWWLDRRDEALEGALKFLSMSQTPEFRMFGFWAHKDTLELIPGLFLRSKRYDLLRAQLLAMEELALVYPATKARWMWYLAELEKSDSG
ncbi:hypothetical protein QOT17_019442 [Balamuthia mandrillaris]